MVEKNFLTLCSLLFVLDLSSCKPFHKLPGFQRSSLPVEELLHDPFFTCILHSLPHNPSVISM